MTKNGDVVFKTDIAFQFNNTSHIKNNNTIFVANGAAERAFNVLSAKVSDVANSATATTSSIASMSFCTRKSRRLSHGQQ